MAAAGFILCGRPTLLPPRRYATSGFLLQFVDPFRCLGLAQVLIELLAGLVGQRLQVGALRASHRLVTSSPLVGILDRVGLLIVFGLALVCIHGRHLISIRLSLQASCAHMYDRV